MNHNRQPVKPSSLGGPSVIACEPDEPEAWYPTVPGPQGHNAGITPGYRAPDARPVTREDVERLAAHLDAGTVAAFKALAARIAHLERQLRQKKAG
ncbi:unnamed protein product [Gemmata massiliana]|uniref:Uncharacterized protein n=1 Tax=Gemmata massiliana TaxID=1210884 RepID=A0A6P2CZV2_9BACT|nr:hypothetical protein [Gemmata massiliana]VTR93334.1 unnamed protein product [Gemmata massiliana]